MQLDKVLILLLTFFSVEMIILEFYIFKHMHNLLSLDKCYNISSAEVTLILTLCLGQWYFRILLPLVRLAVLTLLMYSWNYC